MTAQPQTRSEHDSFGTIEVPAQALWGAQTQRSLQFFAIGEQRMPMAVVHALAQVKRAAAEVNASLGLLDEAKASAIAAAAKRVAAGEFDAEFPLSVWQTGSGTQTHMNVNEVLAHLATASLGGKGYGTQRVHPNDDVNLGQSSNDVFPTAMHVAVALACGPLLQALGRLRLALQHKATAFANLLKIGRTHLQDATPVTLGQEFGGYDAQLGLAEAALRASLPAVHALAIGGTAVGTGLNTHPAFGARVAQRLAARLALPFTVAPDLFAAMAGHEALVGLHGALRMLAIALNKIGNDIRLMGSGPRAGLGELHLPENEPGSSIMPGKVNPTQVEALTMVCAQVMGHDVAIGIAAGQGQFELNVYKPLIALDVLDSIVLLRDAMLGFAAHCVQGIEADSAHLAEQLAQSLMLVTALSPHIGYDRAACIAKQAQQQHSTLREAALASGEISAADFDAWVRPAEMAGTASPAPRFARHGQPAHATVHAQGEHMNTSLDTPSKPTPVDEDMVQQARPGHGIPSQDPDPAAQLPLEPGEAEREANSVLAGGGLMVGAVAGAAIGTAVAGPVGAVVGGTMGAIAGALGGEAAGPLVNTEAPAGKPA